MPRTFNFSDTSLGQKLDLLELLFKRMPMGIAIIDKEFHIQRYNPTWAGFSSQYAPPESAPLEIGVNYFEHIPGSEQLAKPLFERVLAGETIRQDALQMSVGGIISYWDVVLAPIIENDTIIGILNITVDATEREITRQTLEQHVTERTHELSMLLETSRKLSSTLSLDPLLDLILDRLGAAIEYDASSIMVLEEDTLKIAAYRGPIKRERIFNIRFPLDETKANQRVIQAKQPIIIPNIRGKGDLAKSIRDTAGEELETTYGYLSCWMGVPLVIKNKVIGMLTLDHKQANYYASHHADVAMMFANQAAVAIENARLYRIEQERLEESEHRREIAESLRGIIGVLNSSQSLPDTLSFIAKEACQILKSEACLIHHIQDEDQFVAIEASYGLPENLQGFTGFPLLSSSEADNKILNREPVWIDDFTKLKPPSTKELEKISPEVAKWRQLANKYYKAWLAVPLIVQGNVYGSMAFYYAAPQNFDAELIRLSQSFADQAALAIENARLYRLEQERFEESERRRRVAEEFGKILTILNSNRSLDEILDYVSSQAQQLTEADASVIYMIDSEEKTIQLASGCHLPEKFSKLGKLSFSDSSAYNAIVQGKPYIAEDVEDLFTSYTPGNVPLLTALVLEYYRAALLVPVIISDVVYGAIALFYSEPRKFEGEAIRLAESFADQTALAIENANLRVQAEQTAVAAERNRLARDLHDAVTQTLFSSSMIADVLPMIWERNPDEGKRRLEELRILTRGALSEMRTLLVELRPSALADTDLEDLISHQINAFIARTGLNVDFQHECVHKPEPAVKEMFYRITQEALNNIAKHAEASSVQITLSCHAEKIELNIQDDGIGFDAEEVKQEGLGLGIMQERAESVGGRFEIQSDIGAGTELRVIWLGANKEEHKS